MQYAIQILEKEKQFIERSIRKNSLMQNNMKKASRLKSLKKAM